MEELKAQLPETEKRLNGKIYELDRQNALLQAYVARENLVVVGVPEQKNENGREDTELVFNKFVKENLEIEDKMEYQRVHRIFSKKPGPRPIKVRFLRYSDKEAVLRNAKKLRGKPQSVFDDLPPKIREARRILLPHLKEARQQNKKAIFSKSEPDKLIIEGKVISSDWSKLK